MPAGLPVECRARVRNGIVEWGGSATLMATSAGKRDEPKRVSASLSEAAPAHGCAGGRRALRRPAGMA